MSDSVDHPAYYGGADNPYEAIKVIEAWEAGLDAAIKTAIRLARRKK